MTIVRGGLEGAANKRLVLTAMIFAVAMMFIDQTIVSIAVPELQKNLSLWTPGCSGSSTATCWRSRPCSPSAAGLPISRAPPDGDRRDPDLRHGVGALRRNPRPGRRRGLIIVFRVVQGPARR